MKQLFPYLIHLRKRGSNDKDAYVWWRKVARSTLLLSGAGLASGVTLPSFHTLCTDASISITLGARVDHAAGALYGASGSAWMEQANFFYQGL